MNARRGLFRLWLVLSACFALVVLVVFADDLRTHVRLERLVNPTGFDPDAFLADRPSLNPWVLLTRVVAIAVGFPLIALVLGRAALWIVSGFKSDKSNT